MTNINRTIRTFAEITDLYAEETAVPTDRFAHAFAETADAVKLVPTDEMIIADMPDALQIQVGVEMLVTTLFDLLRDTRLETIAERLAWGIVHSFHKVAEQIDNQADHAARELGDLIRENDGGEIATHEIEERQLLCHGLDEASEALSCMRDHAAAMFHAETGRPWSAPRATLVSGKRTASVIAGQDFLAARRQKRIERNAPSGPVVLFSGGKAWEDHALLWERLDLIRSRIPTMVLATTAQDKGCDAIAAAWAARSGIAVVNFALDRRLGMRAGFARNETMMRLEPVEAMVCEGSGLQSHLARLVREAGVPAHFFAVRDQRLAMQVASVLEALPKGR